MREKRRGVGGEGCGRKGKGRGNNGRGGEGGGRRRVKAGGGMVVRREEGCGMTESGRKRYAWERGGGTD